MTNLGTNTRIEFAQIAAVQRRRGLVGLIWPGLDVYLRSGRILQLDETEAKAFDDAQDLHEKTMEVLGMVQAGQTRL